MADNTQLNQPTTAGDIIATIEDAGGIKHQQVVGEFLDPGGEPVQTSAATPLPTTVVSSALPTGAATAANQATEIASLTTIAGDTTSIDGKTPALGQAAMAASVPVAIASNQSAVPISAASLPLPTGAATLAEQQAQTTLLAGGLPAALGAGGGLKIDGSGTAIPVTLAANQSVNLAQVNGQAVDVGAGNAGTGTQRVSISTDDVNLAAINAVAGVVSGAKVITDANGTLQQYLRGLVYLLITAGAQAPRKILWDAAPVDAGDVLTTELNALADGAFSALGTEFDNTSGLVTHGMLEINLASLTPTAGAFIQLFMVPALDGTNYPDAPSATNPGLQYLCTPILNVATGAATKRIASPIFALPPAKVKFALFNDTNVTLGATGNTATLYTFSKELQ